METRNGLPMLTQLFPKDNSIGNTTIDIIAVHGIETQSPRTWTFYERDEEPRGRGTNWLCDEDMLPKVLPQARIWAYDYNSNCYSDNAQEIDILALGDTFLEILKVYQEQGIGERMLIFIGSCFGGIVIAQALARAFRDRARYKRLIDSTIGVIMLGTPFRGTKSAGITQWLVLIRGFMGKETSKTLVDGLREKDNSLNNMIHEFAEMVIQNQIQIRCFYETRETQVAKAVVPRVLAKVLPTIKLVSRDSACLDGHKRIPLNVIHSMMNKYRNSEDGSFKLVSGSLKELLDNSSISRHLKPEEAHCLQSLTSNYEGDKNRNKRRVPGTCMWLLEHEKYLRWCQEPTASLLWVSADPGCGKSVLSRALVDEGLLKPNTGTTSICYYFFKDYDSSRQDSANAICAILHQLFVQKPVLLQYATSSFEHHGANLRTMFSALWSVLEQSAADPAAGEIVCVLDALDECREEARKELIQTLTGFYSSQHRARTHLKFLATSRPYADIERAFHGGIKDMTSIRLRGEDESKQISKEIDLVIDIRVPHICGAREPPFDLDVQQFLISGLKSLDNRTYLWLHLTLDVIENTLESTIHHLRMLISRLPRSVEEAYEKILMRVSSSEHAQTARSLLHIVLAALRPLTLGEIQIALAINKKLEHGEHCKSYNDLVLQSEDAFRVKLRNLCGLFLNIVDSKVYLIHQTAKEFLISKNSSDRSTSLPKPTSEVWRHSLAPVESNLMLLKICLCYLLLCGTEGKSISLCYAARWIDHFQSARSILDESILQSTLDVCEPRSPSFSKWWPEVSSEVYATHNKFEDLRFRIENTDSWTSLMVVSLIGLETMIEFSLEKKSAKPNIQDDNGQTALHFAVEHRHLNAAKILVEEKDVTLNIPDNHGYTPLHSAAESGQLEFVKVFINANGVALNLQNNQGNTALHLATAGDLLEVVKLLIKDKRVILNLQNNDGDTVLHLAVEHDQINLAEFLIKDNHVEPNIQGQHGRTPLHLALQRGHLGVVRLLAEKQGVELTLQDESGRTPLHMAAERGCTETVRLLVEKHGVEFNLEDLPIDAFTWYPERVELHFMWLNAKDKNDTTPLHMAAQSGYTETVKVLGKELGVELNPQDKDGRTPLHLAAERGCTETVKVLGKELGVELNPQDKDGRTPLHLAAERGCTETVKVLVEELCDELNPQDKDGRTPLHLAAERGCTETVKVLVEELCGALRIQDKDGRAPFHTAVRNGHSDVVKVFFEYESHAFDFDPQQGVSLQEWALSKGYIELPRDRTQPKGHKRRRGG